MRDVISKLKRSWPWVAVVGVLGIMYGPTLLAHVRRGLDPRVINDDARQQIYPFFRYADSSLFPSDYIGDYYLDCLPIGFRALYTLTAPLVDPATMSKLVMYLMLLLTVVGIGVAANKLAGKAAAWAAMALVLGASLYLDRMGGGLPRAFGFPVLAWALAALSLGRVRWLAVLVWLGACFYPVAGVIVGIATTLFLSLPSADRGDASEWSVQRRLGFLAVVAGVALVLLLPTIIASSEYAPTITERGVADYPEAGPGGRYAPGSRPPYPGFVESAASAVERGIVGAGRPFARAMYECSTGGSWVVVGSIGVFTLLGWLLFIASSSAARRVVMLGLASLIGYALARIAPPYLYLPTRYPDYVMPLLVVLMVTTSVSGYFAMLRKRSSASEVGSPDDRWREAATLTFCALVLLSLGARGSTRAGLNVEIRRPALYEAIGNLPVDALIAGWPRTAIEDVPYVARRTAFLTYETHQAFHEKYLDAMRSRMRALIDATYATTDDPIVRLRDEHGVTHLLVYLPDLRGQGLDYFKPFDEWIEDAREAAGDQPRALERLVEEHAIYRDGRHALIDLRGINDPT